MTTETIETPIVDLASMRLQTQPNPQDLPIFDGEDGELYCVGHIPAAEFLDAVRHVVADYNGDDPNKGEYMDILNWPDTVRHAYVQGFLSQHGDVMFRYSTKEAQYATPMTIWEP